MKQYLFPLLAALLLWGAAAQAQSFEFQYQGKSLSDGDMVTIAAAEDDLGLGELCCVTNPSNDPEGGLILKMLTATAASGKATLTIDHNTLSPSLLKWCMGGECSLMTGKTMLAKDFSASSSSVQVQFDAEDIQSQGYLIATLTATIGLESHSVTIQFTNGESQPEQEPVWWGYFSESDANASNYEGIGTGKKETFEAAIYVPANHEIAANSTIKAVRIWFDSNITAFSSIKVWVAKKLSNLAAGADYVQSVGAATLQEGVNTITFDTPYSIGNDGVYIGYTVYLKSAVYPIMNGGDYEENSFFIRTSSSVATWSVLDSFGKLALQVLLDGAVIKENSAVPSSFGTSYALIGQTASVPVKVTNMGSEPLKSFAYTITTDGIPSAEKTATVRNLAFNQSALVTIPFPADTDARKYEKALTITQVNGKPNEARKTSATGTLITLTQQPVAVPVVEEFTGTWCGWCPIGFDGMEKAQQTFGDEAVLIAVHSGDVMEITDYAPIVNLASGYPSSLVNRITDVYPAASYLRSSINEALKRVTVAEVQATAQWTDDTQTAIDIDTKTTFAYSDDDADYALAYVLIADGLKGTSSGWSQTNNLSHNADYKDLEFWYNASSKVSNLEFNHVAVGAWSIQDGVDDSLPNGFEAGDANDYTFRADISEKKLVQDKEKLKVAVLLIDRNDGTIVNAAQTTIAAAAAAIADVQTATSAPATCYTLSGKRIATPAKGVNILRHSDGTTQKVVIK